MSLQNSLRLKYQTASAIEKLIAINLLAFVFFGLLSGITSLMQWNFTFVVDWLVFFKDLDEYWYKPWTIITYAFLHADLRHIFFNMLVLYFSGRYFIDYFNGKRAWTVYLLGGISGALLFMISYNLFPALIELGKSQNAYLIGASASVMAILIAVATRVPNLGVRLMFIGSVKFWHIAAFFVVLDLIQINPNTAGTHLAHLGGALFGYLYASQLKKGKDIGSWFEKLMDSVASLFKPRKKSPLKTVHKAKKPKNTTKNTTSSTTKNPNQAKIDAILDKISKSGYDSLTKQEKDFLFKAGKN
ncbi:rhomboid family intramembrane serine protease [uncultured Aquimarina sp.]|uniref:rhomboid family intramembrane serine protease n=1 Tax=uncultured Aquimarina sp. TaxID=575652 RepID=UPI0026104703|nr:rhomboid family intramembrane serine protease [uncultured Aquimarina sp.]